MSVKKHNARDIWNLPKSDIWSLPDGEMILVFDDGEEVTCTNSTTILSWYFGAFHRQYPKMPLLSRHHVKDKQIKKGTETEIQSIILTDCKRTLGNEVNHEDLMLLAFKIQNEIFNDLTTNIRSHVSTITILDFVDVVRHPEIEAANRSVKPTQFSIDQTYDKIWSVLTRPGELLGNTVARMAKSGLVSKGQILQCVGPRGFLTDIDSHIFRKPVLTGYVEGISTLYDSMIESRSASKALMFAKDPVAESEYFNREMQLVASTLTRLHRVDCGSKEYILFKVRSGDLDMIAGKYHYDNGKLYEITPNDRHLIGKIIKIRSVLKCHHPDPYGVCEVCFGALSDSIPDNTNLGHASVTVMCEKISQNVLSTKHLDGSSKVDDFIIGEFDSKYIRSGSDIGVDELDSNTFIKLAERLAGKKVYLTLAEQQASNLSDIDYSDVNKLSPSNVTELTEVQIGVEDDAGQFIETVTIPVSMGARRSWLTHDALKYIKKKGFRLSDRGNYVIDLSEWDNTLPLFQLPLKHTDMVQYMKTIKSFIMAAGEPSRGKLQKTLRDFPTVDRGLTEFYALISSKLKVNIAHLEAIILSAMIRSEVNKDHRLPRPIHEGELGSYRKNMEMRSMGTSMAYERQSKRLTDIRSFLYKRRPDSPFDNLLAPFKYVNPKE